MSPSLASSRQLESVAVMLQLDTTQVHSPLVTPQVSRGVRFIRGSNSWAGELQAIRVVSVGIWRQ